MKKIRKHSLAVIISIGIAIAISIWILSFLLSQELEERIRAINIGAYKTTIRDVKISLSADNIVLLDVRLNDTLGAVCVSIPEIRLEGVHLVSIIFQRKMILDKILVKEPNINLHSGLDKKIILPQKRIHTSKFNLLDFGRLQILNGRLLVDNQDSIKQDSIFSTQFYVDMWGISTYRLKKYTYRETSFDSIHFLLKNGNYKLPNKLYRIKYQLIKYSSNEKQLNIDSIVLKSEYPKYEIGKQTGTETDWFDFNVQGICMENIRLNDLLSDSALISSQIRIKNFAGMAFKDKRLPFPEKPDTKLPMEMFNSLPLACHIDSIIVENADIEYAERVDESNNAGMVSFNKLSAKIENMSNIDSLIAAPTTMYVSAKVMNKAILTANFVFPNVKYPGPYRAKGQMGRMQIESFNPMLRQNASIIVKSGEIKQFSFDFQYNNERSDGNLYFEYTNLKIALFNQSDYKIKTVKSFFVNTIALHKENLKDNHSFRKGSIAFERDKKKSIFNFWWKSLLSGIKSIAIL